MRKFGVMFAGAVITVAAVLIFAGSIQAQDEGEGEGTQAEVVEATPALDNPRTFALGITTMLEPGFGVMARMRFNHFAFEGAVASRPWYLSYQTADGSELDYDFGMSFHPDLAAIGFINSDQSRFQNGIRIAAAYDTIAGKMASLGWNGELTFTSFALCFGVGIQYYPDIIENLHEAFPDSKNAEIKSSERYQGYLSINCIWYLF